MKMTDYPLLKEVRTDGYSLLAVFDNSVKKTLNMASLIDSDPFFAKLKDISLFSKAFVKGKGYAVVWNEDIDLASEYIYDKGV